MNAYVSVTNFGTDEQKGKLCDDISRVAIFSAYVNNNGLIIVPCCVSELGGLFEKLAADSATNWVEYTVQFEH